VTIGGNTFAVPTPFLVMATQNPIESEGTYPLPEAQVDRFLFKLMVGYPTPGEEASVVGRSLRGPVAVEKRLDLGDLETHRRTVAEVFVDRDVVGYAVSLADATRRPAEHGLADLVPFIEYGASPRGPIGLVHSARALAVLRGRRHVVAADVRDLAADVLRHRLVLSYDALAEGVSADDILSRVIEAIPLPAGERRRAETPPAGDRFAA
jgi:MoxR-like ATPase